MCRAWIRCSKNKPFWIQVRGVSTVPRPLLRQMVHDGLRAPRMDQHPGIDCPGFAARHRCISYWFNPQYSSSESLGLPQSLLTRRHP